MLRAVTPLYGPSQASSFSSSSPGEKKNYSLRCRVQREEQDSSHSLAVFLPDFRQPSKKLKPACVPSSLHIPLLEHCNHWSGSALAQQHKQPSVRQLPKWGQLLGELKVGVEQTSFLRKKKCYFNISWSEAITQGCCQLQSQHLLTTRTSSGIENRAWIRSDLKIRLLDISSKASARR